MMLESSGISWDGEFDLTNHAADHFTHEELNRLLYCPKCNLFMVPMGPKRMPLQYSDKHSQWEHKECAT